MSITIADSKIQPSLVFDKLHVDTFTLRQDRVNGVPKRRVESAGTRYAVDSNGDKVYDGNSYQVNVSDFALIAVNEYIANNPGATVTDAMTAYGVALAAVASELSTGIDTFKLMAYFEAAVGRVYELTGNTGQNIMGG